MKETCQISRNGLALRPGAMLAIVAAVSIPLAICAAEIKPEDSRPVTFSKDIAPIFQRKCESCHRPGTAVPMSLITYNEVRPWARAIRTRVLKREMPPWHLDKTVGIRQYKNDISLSDDQIATIVRWVDNGAVEGNPADMPPPLTFASDRTWFIGTPDLLATTDKDFTMYA